jgi:hypothetical protein
VEHSKNVWDLLVFYPRKAWGKQKMTEDWNTPALLTVLYIDLLEFYDVIGMR